MMRSNSSTTRQIRPLSAQTNTSATPSIGQTRYPPQRNQSEEGYKLAQTILNNKVTDVNQHKSLYSLISSQQAGDETIKLFETAIAKNIISDPKIIQNYLDLIWKNEGSLLRFIKNFTPDRLISSDKTFFKIYEFFVKKTFSLKFYLNILDCIKLNEVDFKFIKLLTTVKSDNYYSEHYCNNRIKNEIEKIFYVAINDKLIDKIRYLINENIINFNEQHGEVTALNYLVFLRDVGLINTLSGILRGKAININFQLVDKQGDTPLHLAFFSKDRPNINIIKWLLDNNVNPNHINNSGKTAFQLAIEYGDPNLIQLLREYGAEFLDEEDISEEINARLAETTISFSSNLELEGGGRASPLVPTNCDRIIESEARAIRRRPFLIKKYREIFEHRTPSGSAVTIGRNRYKADEYLELHLNETYLLRRKSIPLKKVFEVLQAYHHIEDTPVLVHLNIGGIDGRFMLSPWETPSQNCSNDNQVAVSVIWPSKKEYTAPKYSTVIKRIKSFKENKGLTREKNMELARRLKICLNSPVNEQGNTLLVNSKSTSDKELEFINSEQQTAVVALLAITQTAESAFGADAACSRTAWANKMARDLIKKIGEGHKDIDWDVFRDQTREKFYLPIGQGGTDRMRKSSETCENSPYELSDDSGDEF